MARDGLDDVRQLLSGVLPGVRLDAGDQLAGGDRSEVTRVRARFPDADETSVIVKRFRTAGEGWAREAAALTALPADAPVPRLIVESGTPPTVVLSDLGTGPNVAAALLGDDADDAANAVLAWTDAVARLHRSGLGSRDRFRAELALRAGDLPIADHVMPTVVDEAALLLETRVNDIGVTPPSGALTEMRQIARDLAVAENASLSPSDTCPDDNVRTADGAVLLVDFEGAQWRHIAWDVAYLTVPWPTCWCSWLMPADLAERAVERYRAAIEDVLPYVRTPEFRQDLSAAALGWGLVSTAWLLPEALGDDPPPANPRRTMPRRRAMILHRLDRARRVDHYPAAATFAGRLRDLLVDHWGEVRLGYAPAFE